MKTIISKEFKRYSKNCHILKRMLFDTCNAIDDISKRLILGKQICDEVFSQSVLRQIETKLGRSAALLVFGQDCHSKALFVNHLLNNSLLPLCTSRWRHVNISYSMCKSVSLMLGYDFEIVEALKADEKPWQTIPTEDLFRTENEYPTENCPSLEVGLPHALLTDARIIVPADCNPNELLQMLQSYLKTYLPVVLYVISGRTLSNLNVEEIRRLKEHFSVPILYVVMTETECFQASESLTESQRHLLEGAREHERSFTLSSIQNKLTSLGLLKIPDVQKNSRVEDGSGHCLECSIRDFVVDACDLNQQMSEFLRHTLRYTALKVANQISELHNKCLRRFILSAFDMAREVQITHRRMEYADQIEQKLFNTLMSIVKQQQDRIVALIQSTLNDMRSKAREIVESFDAEYQQTAEQWPRLFTLMLQQFVLRRLRDNVASEIIQSVSCLQESFTGTLRRCLQNLEQSCRDSESGSIPSVASEAVARIVSVAYSIDFCCVPSSASVLHTFFERMCNMLSTLLPSWMMTNASLGIPFSHNYTDNVHLRILIVTNIIDSLSVSKLARSLSVQFQEHVTAAHETFQTAIRSLEDQLREQLDKTESQRVKIRKRFAPRFARLALESMSLCDFLWFGIPKQVREIGRGQYGVVFACEPWAGIDPCAVKSVVPPDDRQWYGLAMEFRYTRTIPEHPRIVKIRGSVINYNYGSDNSVAVLLVMDKLKRDLFSGLRSGLTWLSRMQIAIDVVEGLRYLHSQGLVHRDIKLKNVLLDDNDRAKLSDFGFCTPEALISGSVVGTPIHMAPELQQGRYDSSVDVYAFGILFWYLCAGDVQLPRNFDQFQSKEELWTMVGEGIRPEKLTHFRSDCWQLMNQCWANTPVIRPLLGDIQPQLEAIFELAKAEAVTSVELNLQAH